MASYRQALTLDAAFKPSRQNLAQALIQQKRHSEALEQFERFGQIQGLNATETVVGLQGRIACLMELGRYGDGLAVADGCHEDRRVQLMTRLHVLPVLYASDSEVCHVRQRWSDDARSFMSCWMASTVPMWPVSCSTPIPGRSQAIWLSNGDDLPLRALCRHLRSNLAPR